MVSFHIIKQNKLNQKAQRLKETFGGNGYVYYFDRGDDFTAVCKCTKSSNNMC